MRSLLPAALLAITLSPDATGQTQRNEPVEREIAQMDRDYNEARLRNDVAAVNRFLAPDYYSINTGAQRNEAGNKGAGPYDRTPNGVRWEKVEVRDQRVRVYGESAVSTYRRLINVRTQDGASRLVGLVLTNVWVRRDSRWMIVLTHATPINEGP